MQFTPRAHFLAQAFPGLPVLLNDHGELKLDGFEWCVIAGYMNTPDKIKQQRFKMGNARSERILEKGSVWNKIRQQRCLIPANGFYEHREIEGMPNKVPYYITRNDQEGVLMAGLYNYSPMEPHQGTFSVVMRPANEKISLIHNSGDNSFRMPLQFQNVETALEWINPDLKDDDIGDMISYAIPSEKFDAWPVYSVRGRSERPDHKEKYEPFEYPGLPGIYENPVLPEEYWELKPAKKAKKSKGSSEIGPTLFDA